MDLLTPWSTEKWQKMEMEFSSSKKSKSLPEVVKEFVELCSGRTWGLKLSVFNIKGAKFAKYIFYCEVSFPYFCLQ